MSTGWVGLGGVGVGWGCCLVGVRQYMGGWMGRPLGYVGVVRSTRGPTNISAFVGVALGC